MVTTFAEIQRAKSNMTSLKFDEDGFLLNPSAWSRELASELAQLDGIGPLTSSHWGVIDYVRERYLQYGSLPLMRRVCRANHLDRTTVKQLFGGCRAIWRVAGLPNPGEEAKTYMD